MIILDMIKNTFKPILVGILLGLSSAVIADGNAVNGGKLFAESTCATQCHGTEKFTASDRKVDSIAKLETAVRHWDSSLNTNWFDDEIIDVTAYLNKTYYKFK